MKTFALLCSIGISLLLVGCGGFKTLGSIANSSTSFDYKWTYTNWDQCTAVLCDQVGLQNREVICVGINGQKVDDDLCIDVRPIETQVCYSRSCTSSYFWQEYEWSPCSAVQCGTNGAQNRTVACINDLTKEITGDMYCTGVKPEIYQTCSAPACP